MCNILRGYEWQDNASALFGARDPKLCDAISTAIYMFELAPRLQVITASKLLELSARFRSLGPVPEPPQVRTSLLLVLHLLPHCCAINKCQRHEHGASTETVSCTISMKLPGTVSLETEIVNQHQLPAQPP